MADAPFPAVISGPEQLDALYRPPSPIVVAKSRPVIDPATAAFLARSTFVVLGTSGPDGTLDASPRGGPPGFVHVLDEHRLALPDLPGNNRLDALRNVVATGRIALLAVVTGQHETVRVNGRAWVTTDPELLGSFPPELRRPTTAIGIEVEETFIHCAKAFRRGGVWDPATWHPADAPDAASIIECQNLLDGVPAAAIRADLDRSYDVSLAEERTDRGDQPSRA